MQVLLGAQKKRVANHLFLKVPCNPLEKKLFPGAAAPLGPPPPRKRAFGPMKNPLIRGRGGGPAGGRVFWISHPY